MPEPAAPPARSMRWPPPLPGRARWAWLLGLRCRGWRVRRLLRLLDGRVAPGSTVVDVGAGPGYTSMALARRHLGGAGNWLLLDPQRAMWASDRARRRAASQGFTPSRVVGDASDLPLRSGSVDVALSVGVFCCMNDAAIPAAIAETVRVLRPGGWFLFGVPRWRGEYDVPALERAGLARVAEIGLGRTLFQKPL